MYSIQEQFKTDALAQLNSKVRDAQLIAGNILELSREIGVLNVRTTKASAEVLAGAVQKLLSASNPGEFFQRAASVMRPDMQVWTSYTEQLRSIAGKMTAPLAASLALAEDYVHAPAAAPEVSAPEPEAEAPAAFAAPVEETDAAPVAPAAPEPAVDKVAVQPEAVVAPSPAASEQAVAEPPLAASKAWPETPEVIKDVAAAMAGMSKASPAVHAAPAPSKAQTVASAPAAARTSVKPASRKPPVRQAPKKAGPPARSGANRGKKS